MSDVWATPDDLAAAIPLALVVIGQDRRIRLANPAATALFGGALTGRHYLLTLRQPALQAAIEAALTRGEAAQVRLVRAEGGGAETVYRVTLALMAGKQAVALTFEDLTEAEQAAQMRRDFVANVSHELRTPLTALSGFIETLQGAARDDPGARDRFLQIMAHEAGRMNRLVQDLLALSRVEGGERIRPSDRVDVQALLAPVLASLQPLAQAFATRLEVTGETAALIVPGDADQLTQVLTNLIENAVKYGGEGGLVRVHLAQDRLPAGLALRIDVIDQGPGIESQHLPRLTERFYRVDGHRSRAVGGTGLGLAIVKHIVNRHRGRMKIESKPGKGSVFSVLLPVA